MKAIFINNDIQGILNFRLEVIDSFLQDEWDVSIVIPTDSSNSRLLKRIPKGWNICYAHIDANSISPLKDMRYLRDLVSILKREKPDIVMTYTVKPNIYGSIACHICKIPCISMMAGLGYLFNGDGVKKKLGIELYRYALKRATKIVVLNKQNYSRLLTTRFTNPTKLIWLESGEGVNLQKYKKADINYDNVRFLMIARILYDKGYTEFVEAARIVKKKYPEVRFEILGSPDFTSKMGVPPEVLEKDKEEGIVDFLGLTDDVASYMSRPGTVVTLPSKHEGLNKSLMEACSVGCPIIASDIPGCQETVQEGVNGFLVPPSDVQALVDAMLRMIELTPRQRKEMAEQSRILAEQKFDVNNVIRAYKKLVSEILNR